MGLAALLFTLYFSKQFHYNINFVSNKQKMSSISSSAVVIGPALSLSGSWRHADNQLRNLRLCCLAVVDSRVPFPETFLYLANSIDISTSQPFTYLTDCHSPLIKLVGFFYIYSGAIKFIWLKMALLMKNKAMHVHIRKKYFY